MPPQNTNQIEQNNSIPPVANDKKWIIVPIIGLIIIIISVLALYYVEKIKEKSISENNNSTFSKQVKQVAVLDENASSTKRLAEIEIKLADLHKEILSLQLQASKLDSYNNKKNSDNFHALMAKVDSLMLEGDKLRKEYTEIQTSLDNKLISGADTLDTAGIYDKYCLGLVNINYKNTDYSSELTSKLDGLKIQDLGSNLINDIYSDNQIPEALQYLGLKLMQGGKIDESLKIYKCAAEKYYDMTAMYRMARVYQGGTDDIKKQLPNAVITDNIKADSKETYYWLLTMFYVELAEKTGNLNASSQLGWNTIAMFDDLQNILKLTNKEETDIENKVRDFIGKRYPEVLDNNRLI